MGNMCAGMDEEALRSRELDKKLKKDGEREKKIVKLLLLGTGESGKSTIVKQMKILEAQDKKAGESGFSKDERDTATNHIRNNTVDGLLSLLHAVDTLPNLANKLEGNAVIEAKNALEKEGEAGGNHVDRLTPDLWSAVKLLWQQEVIQECLKRKHEFTMLDSAPYFLAQVDAIAADDYSPTDQDIVRARSMTTGIVVVPFQVNELTFQMVDVGGQRSERKKWIHQFDKVTAVMFIIALSEYDQMLYEDETINRIQESENLFQQMLTNLFFTDTDFIVFFNKADLFKEKLKKVPLKTAYPDYTGPQEYDEAKNFVIQKFMRHNKSKNRDVHPFTTTATDTDLVKKVFSTVKEIIINKILGGTGLK